MDVDDKLAKEKLIREVHRINANSPRKELSGIQVAQLIRNTDLTDCQQTKELRLWDIHVECWYRSGDNLEAIRRVITVEAKDSDDAKKRAIDYCDSTASCDKEWKDFEFVRGHTVERPEYPLEAQQTEAKSDE